MLHDSHHQLGVDPGLVKDGLEEHLQALLAEHTATLGPGFTLIRREYPTAIGPVDLLCRDADGLTVAVEIKPQAQTLATDRGIRCVTVDYDDLRGTPSNNMTLF